MQGVAGRLDTGGISDAWDRMRRYAGKPNGAFSCRSDPTAIQRAPYPEDATSFVPHQCDYTGDPRTLGRVVPSHGAPIGPFPGRKQSRALGL